MNLLVNEDGELDPYFNTEDAFSFLLNDYAPTDDFTKADVYLTTQEVWNLLRENVAGDFGPGVVAIFLRDHGFQMQSAGELKYVWLFKNK